LGGIETWSDVDRLDVRPGKGMLKVRAKNRWEIPGSVAPGSPARRPRKSTPDARIANQTHTAAVPDDLARRPRFFCAPYPLYDFTSSGLTLVAARYAAAPNRHRVAGLFVDHNFGLVEIDWSTRPHPAIKLKAVGADGRAGLEHAVALEALD
jgi:hypothetical protein